MFRSFLDKVLDAIDIGNKKNFSEEVVNNGLIMQFDKITLRNASEMAEIFIRTADNNDATHKDAITAYCVDDNSQYLGILEAFMKSSSSAQIARDILFLRFALKLMEERGEYKGDFLSDYYVKVKKAMIHLNALK